jgi:peptidylprolyl isomerase
LRQACLQRGPLAFAPISVMARPRAYLVIDIGGHRAAHDRVRDFVAATSLRYGLSSARYEDLGGSERARLAELYASDYEWSSRGRIELSPARSEILEIELFSEEAPNACKNFMGLCAGNVGRAKGSNLPLHYKGSRVHRLVAGSFFQGGDFVFGNGSGGESIYGGTFKDDAKALKLPIDSRGILCMSNTGKNTNGSQFFITLAPQPKLTGRHCVFGRVVSGGEVLEMIEAVECDGETPKTEILICDCGLRQ